ncbi:hypothetical protein JHN63_04445 [Streptomyces sp. MBT65]|uniref:hypothetical protein n=1 Tax=Streptomyces sp. MBT65 TaxID=1488395 RepID=UPI00190ABEB7|nr:hypothetical protein [Streptomyces sp. MBT65]MBK3573082.1 hypothetical protein [Streptomyces sp. MBT65]
MWFDAMIPAVQPAVCTVALRELFAWHRVARSGGYTPHVYVVCIVRRDAHVVRHERA